MQRLKAEKNYYDEGRIMAVRYLDAVSRTTEAVAAEAACASEYNTSLAALGESKDSLLEERFILVIDQPLRIPKNWVAAPGQPVERPSAGARSTKDGAGKGCELPAEAGS